MNMACKRGLLQAIKTCLTGFKVVANQNDFVALLASFFKIKSRKCHARDEIIIKTFREIMKSDNIYNIVNNKNITIL